MGFRSTVDLTEMSPVLVWGQRFLIVILFLLCGLALAADRLFPGRTDKMRSQATDLLAPLVNTAGVPVRWSKRRVQGVQAFIHSTEMAARADDLAVELEFTQMQVARRDQTIDELRSNINLPPEELETYLTARVLLEGDSLFAASLVLNVGSRDGGLATSGRNPGNVRPGLAVVTHQGILGRLQSVGENSSRVRLITSQNSALPVLVGDFRLRGTAFGNDTNFLTLITEEALPGTISIGDQVLTSTIDPDIPFLFHVGEIIRIIPDIQIRPAAIDPNNIDGFVQVVLKEALDQRSSPDADLNL